MTVVLHLSSRTVHVSLDYAWQQGTSQGLFCVSFGSRKALWSTKAYSISPHHCNLKRYASVGFQKSFLFLQLVSILSATTRRLSSLVIPLLEVDKDDTGLHVCIYFRQKHRGSSEVMKWSPIPSTRVLHSPPILPLVASTLQLHCTTATLGMYGGQEAIVTN